MDSKSPLLSRTSPDDKDLTAHALRASKRYCQIYCQIRGAAGVEGNGKSFSFGNLLIPKITPPSSNPSLSAN
jgi:hypothetical protein